MTDEEKIAFVETEIAACEAGRQEFVRCPYCEAANQKGSEELCCRLFTATVLAIMEKEEMNERREFAEHVLDQHLTH